jgi:integrase
MADTRKLETTRYPGIYRRHANGCAGARCDCPYVVRWKHRGKGHKRMFGTLAEAREFKGHADSGHRAPPSRLTVEGYYEGWIQTYRGRTRRGLEATTRKEYERSFASHVLPIIGRVPLRELTAGEIRSWFGDLERRGVSPNTIRKAKAALSAMLATATEDDAIPANPAREARYVASREAQERHRRAPRHKLTAADVGAILAAMPERWRTFFELLVQSGVRIGELLGLTWGRVDLGDHPCILVTEQVYEGERKRLKTEASVGRVPLSSGMARQLAAIRRDDAGADAPVFPSSVGTPLGYSAVYNRVLRPALRDSGLARQRDDGTWDYRGIAFHAFRKACGSLLLANGRSVKQVQGWLRHGELTTTLRHYVHEVDDGLGDADVWDEIGDWGHRGATAHPDSAEPRDSVEEAETAQ